MAWDGQSADERWGWRSSGLGKEMSRVEGVAEVGREPRQKGASENQGKRELPRQETTRAEARGLGGQRGGPGSWRVGRAVQDEDNSKGGEGWGGLTGLWAEGNPHASLQPTSPSYAPID